MMIGASPAFSAAHGRRTRVAVPVPRCPRVVLSRGTWQHDTLSPKVRGTSLVRVLTSASVGVGTTHVIFGFELSGSPRVGLINSVPETLEPLGSHAASVGTAYSDRLTEFRQVNTIR